MKGKKNQQTKNDHDDVTATLNYVFNINHKDVVENEIKGILEHVESDSLKMLKLPILLNFISYKFKEIDYHSNLAKSIQNECGETIKNILNYEDYDTIKSYVANYLKIDDKTSMVTKEENKNQSQNLHVKTNLKSSNNVEPDLGQQNSSITYPLRIFYQDSTESSGQVCNITIDKTATFNTFVSTLKQQLGIYEYSKFQIVSLDENHKSAKYILKDLKHLNTNSTNYIKLTPAIN